MIWMVAANHHEANGIIERDIQTLRMKHNRLCAVDHRSRRDDLVQRATNGKNLIQGSKLLSAFWLLYAVQHRILDRLNNLMTPLALISAQCTCTAHDSVNLMIQKPPHGSKVHHLVLNLQTFFLGDGKEWLGPAKILDITQHNVGFFHNDHFKTPPLHRIKQIRTDAMIDPESDNDIPTTPYPIAKDTVLLTIEPVQPASSHRHSKLRREALSLQANANRIVNGLSPPQLSETTNHPSSWPVGHANNKLIFLCRLERLAAKQTTNDTSTNLLFQPSLTTEKN